MKKVLKVLSAVSMLTIGNALAQDDSVSVNQSSSESGKSQNESSDKSQNQLTEEMQNLKGKLAGLEESYLETKSTVEKLSKVKISGYIQAQCRFAADTSGQHDTAKAAAPYTNRYSIGDFNGGAFSQGTRSEFNIRRSRVKVAYESALSSMALTLECSPTGLSIKEADLRFVEPWFKSVAFKAGVFDRPFGFEVGYSSGSLESPERSRVCQTLFPGEQDMGFAFEYLGSDNLPAVARLFNFKGGWFAGNGVTNDFQGLRDFIGRFGLSIPLTDINVAIDGGVSVYSGSVINRNDSLYEIKNNAWSLKKVSKHSTNSRSDFGVDGQIYYGDIPFFGGISLRGEYIKGTQPSVKGSSKSQSGNTPNTAPYYMRNVQGYYAMLLLNVDPIKCQLVGKYDVFDPNTKLSGTQVTSNADMKYKTFGYGLIYHWSENVKLEAYYENVRNEKIADSKHIYSNELKDDVVTLRIQYKF